MKLASKAFYAMRWFSYAMVLGVAIAVRILLNDGRITFTQVEYGQGLVAPHPLGAQYVGPTHPISLLLTFSVGLFSFSLMGMAIRRWRQRQAA